jgi:hypothetical protein
LSVLIPPVVQTTTPALVKEEGEITPKAKAVPPPITTTAANTTTTTAPVTTLTAPTASASASAPRKNSTISATG